VKFIKRPVSFVKFKRVFFLIRCSFYSKLVLVVSGTARINPVVIAISMPVTMTDASRGAVYFIKSAW
jgi:hypothetical protein